MAQCELCGRELAEFGFYVVRIDVFADPSTPPLVTPPSGDMSAEIANLLDELKDRSADELQDQIHRRFEYRVCPNCQAKFLTNPLGKPRQSRAGEN
jgi:hypothetical protein